MAKCHRNGTVFFDATLSEVPRRKYLDFKTAQRHSHCGSVVTNPSRSWVQSLASFSGLRIPHCHELWCRSQTWLRSFVAVAVACVGNCSSDSTPGLVPSICCRCSPEKKKKKPPRAFTGLSKGLYTSPRGREVICKFSKEHTVLRSISLPSLHQGSLFFVDLFALTPWAGGWGALRRQVREG